MHRTTRHTCVGDVGSPVGGVGVVAEGRAVDVPAPGRSVAAGTVVSGAGVSATCLPLADPGAVRGAALSAGRVVAADFGCGLAVAGGGTATAVLCCRPAVVGGRVVGCRGPRVSGCSDDEPVGAVRGAAVVTGSGGDATWA
ncbi:hypothetical protein [Streptomyces sp. NPDC002889]|uniref:hypothetical protein n=1 Tax=Streptomyces sp. NPDC002889 TaxID=3364669 RepID=UPI0036B28D15